MFMIGKTKRLNNVVHTATVVEDDKGPTDNQVKAINLNDLMNMDKDSIKKQVSSASKTQTPQLMKVGANCIAMPSRFNSSASADFM